MDEKLFNGDVTFFSIFIIFAPAFRQKECGNYLPYGVIGNTSDSGSEVSRFDPW